MTLRFFVFLLSFFLVPSFSFASSSPVFGVDVSGVTVAQLVRLCYRDIEEKSFFFPPEIEQDKRVLSVSLSGTEPVFNERLSEFFKTLGYSVEDKKGVFVLSAIPEFKTPSAYRDVFVYRPKFRTASYLIQSLQGLFRGSFASQSQVHNLQSSGVSQTSSGSSGSSSYASTSARALQDNGSEVLVYEGTPEEIQKLKKVLPSLDTHTPDVFIRAWVYVVQTSAGEGSAFSFAMNLLKSKVAVSYGAQAAAATGSLTFSTSAVDAVVSALSSDTHFKVVSSPSVRAKSGSSASFNSGAQVPVLGSTTTTGTGSTVQSISYMESGVIFTVIPDVREGIINLTVKQELSDFAETTTGVNGSPTLNKRSLNSELSLRGGTTIMLGGLTLDQLNKTKQGFSFMPEFLDATNQNSSRTEVLLLLSIDTID